MLRNYLVVAWRNLRKNPAYSLINGAGLSLGLATCALIFLYVKDEVSFDRFHARADRLYRLTTTYAGGPLGAGQERTGLTGDPQGPALARELPEVEGFVRFKTTGALLRKGSETFQEQILLADTSFLSVFSFPLLAGNPQTALSDPNGVVISEKMALKYFGRTNALGQSLEKQRGEVFERLVVTGVAANPPQNSSIAFTFLSRYAPDPETPGRPNWTMSHLNTFVLLRPGTDPRAVEAKLPALVAPYLAAANAQLPAELAKAVATMRTTFGLQPLRRVHLQPEWGAGNGVGRVNDAVLSYILSCIGALILLIACINFVTLTLARSLRRGKEVGIRKAAGGTQAQLRGQFLGESFLLTLLATLPAAGLIHLGLPFFNQLTNKKLSFTYLLDAPLVIIFAALVVGCALLAGWYPAVVLSRLSPTRALFGGPKLTGKNYFGQGLVVFQFALAIALVIGTITFQAQFRFLLNKDLGYRADNVLSVNLPYTQLAQSVAFRDALRQQTAFETVTARDGISPYGSNTSVFKANGQNVPAAFGRVDEQYLTAFRIPLRAGRNFSPAFPSDTARGVLINAAFAKAAGWTDAVGKQISRQDGETYTVVGVTRDFHHASLQKSIEPLLMEWKPSEYYEICARVRPGQMARATALVEKLYRRNFPWQPFSYSFLDEQNAKLYETEANWKRIVTLAAAVSIFIACIGLFGLATLSIQQRTKEIGIRKVLGASAASVVGLLTKDFMKLVGLAFVVATPVAWYASNRFLQYFAYRISLGWWIFAAAGSMALGIALLTVGYQAIRAARANPVKSLRTE